MGFRINRGIFQKLEADGRTYTNAFKVGDDGRLKEVDADGNPVGDYLKVGEKASDADFLDGLDSSSFITTSGGTISGSLTIASAADNNRFQKDGSFVNPKDPWSNFHIKAGHGQMYMDASVYHIRPQNGSTDWLYINSANLNVNLDRLNVKRHIDANTGWSGGSAEVFLGWYSDKIVLGNDNYGMHDNARDMPLNSISLNNPLYSWKNIALGKNASMPTAEWGATGDSTGFVVIEFPVNSYAMIHAEIAVYEYNGNNASTVLVGGHPWNGGWYQYGSKTLGVLNKQVRFGRINATGVYCIVLGDAGSLWRYGQVQLKRIQNGNYYDNRVAGNGSYRIYQSQDEGIFSMITADTSGGIDVNRAATADYASNSNLLDNINSTQFLRSDANDTFTNLTGTSITIGEAVIGQHAVHSGYYGMWNTEASTGTTQQYMIISAGTETYVNGDNVYIRAGNNSTSNEVKITTSGTYIGGNKVWHAGNDGSGSGLDADTVDGYHASRLFRIDSSTADSRGPDFDALMPSSNETYFKEVHAINEGANIPSGAYTYGMVQSTYMSSMKLQWYIPHTASRGNSNTQDTIYFRTNWGGGTWYGWKYLIHSGNIAGQSVNYANSAGDSSLLGGIASDSFLRSDTSDSMYGQLSIYSGSQKNHGFEVSSSVATYRSDAPYWRLWQPNSTEQIAAVDNGEVRLSYDGTTRLKTFNGGAQTLGSHKASSFTLDSGPSIINGSSTTTYWNSGSTGSHYIQFRRSDNVRTGGLYWDSNGNYFGLLNKDGQWAIRTDATHTRLYYDGNERFRGDGSGTVSEGRHHINGYLYATSYGEFNGDVIGNRFIDRNNTGYYLDPASTSRLEAINGDRYYQVGHGRPTNNLGSPTVTEMALFNEQFTNKTAFHDPAKVTFWVQWNDGAEWENLTRTTGYDENDIRRFIAGYDTSDTIAIPNLCYAFRIEVEAKNYTFANAVYLYWSSQSHSTRLHIWKKRCDNNQWYQHTNSDDTVSSWPGHLYLPMNGIAWHETNTTSSGHYNTIRLEFLPNWSGSATYGDREIHLYKLQIWGGYPAGTRYPYTVNEWGDFYPKRDIYAYKYYDRDNSGYYLEPASVSNISQIQINNTSSFFTGQGSQLSVENLGSFARFAFNRLNFYDWQYGEILDLNNGLVSTSGTIQANRLQVDGGDNYIDTIANYLHLASKGNEIIIGGSTSMYVNYRASGEGTPTNWYWKAGSSSSWSNHSFGNISANGNISATGAVTATSFAGDGAALTNLPVQSIPVFEEGSDTELSITRIDFSTGQGAAIVTLSNGSTYRLGFAR